MTVFISYNHSDVGFVDWLANRLVSRRHHIWMDRWELNVGDSLISRVQAALTASDAIIIVLSTNSIASEWCKKELNSGILRELEEKRVLVLPCVIDHCTVPLFLREKLYADFRKDREVALDQVHDALLRITNPQQGRLESPDFHTDWSYDWSKGRSSRRWYFEWTFVDHGPAIEYCILTECKIACNQLASDMFQNLDEGARQDYILRVFALLVSETAKRQSKIRIRDAFRQIGMLEMLGGSDDEEWLVEISSRRMGIDNGKDTLVHVDQILERALSEMNVKLAKPNRATKGER
ncbi:TIR [Rhodopseudomonas palustris HaA2]|uniref:TIR n=1 Tax=Rhodopseudomonas palustris (strain HaA2) TaxID=316058 RepID=Q2IWS6_RHOP2|nr:toll/interleukin-1 receptor domain-containing protein [Rhodopseudomonas palustris]ABD07334.1 TIR [Rhodopseudomonas palustris HaA2]